MKQLVAKVDSLKEIASGLTKVTISSKELRLIGPFHSKLIQRAQKEKKLSQMLDRVPLTLPTDFLLYSNVTGTPYTSVEEIRRLLRKQIIEPVQWQHTIQEMTIEGKVTKFYECGPMNSLSRMGRNIQSAIKSSSISGMSDSQMNHSDLSNSDIETGDEAFAISISSDE